MQLIASSSTDRDLPSPAMEAAQAGSGTASDVSASDTGAQRPLLLKKSGFSAQFGYDSKISYKQNPLGGPGVLDNMADAVWENRFHGRAKLGVYDMDSSVVTPFVGGSWSMTDFTFKGEDSSGIATDLSDFNFNTTTAFLLFLMQHESGWAFRGGVMYANDRSTEEDTEDYSEFYPVLGSPKHTHLVTMHSVFWTLLLGLIMEQLKILMVPEPLILPMSLITSISL